jgi:uncharacterized protein YegP (UPF0339 family)
MAKKSPEFQIFPSRNGFGVRLVARNGEKMAVGETYTRIDSATRAIKSFVVAAIRASEAGAVRYVEPKKKATPKA